VDELRGDVGLLLLGIGMSVERRGIPCAGVVPFVAGLDSATLSPAPPLNPPALSVVNRSAGLRRLFLPHRSTETPNLYKLQR